MLNFPTLIADVSINFTGTINTVTEILLEQLMEAMHLK